MPVKLATAFEDTIGRIRNQKSERAIQAIDVLKWTFLAERQLTVTELRHALSVSLDSHDSGESDSDEGETILTGITFQLKVTC
jgi:hypothetical protein